MRDVVGKAMSKDKRSYWGLGYGLFIRVILGWIMDDFVTGISIGIVFGYHYRTISCSFPPSTIQFVVPATNVLASLS